MIEECNGSGWVGGGAVYPAGGGAPEQQVDPCPGCVKCLGPSDDYAQGYRRGVFNGFTAGVTLCVALELLSRVLGWP